MDGNTTRGLCGINNKNNMSEVCPLCSREMLDDGISTDLHHWIPKSKKGSDVSRIHKICHNKIHSLWTENELRDYYNTPERILSHPDMKKFVKWLKRKPADFYVKTRDSNIRKGKRRR
jgi:hypothetical protein